MTIAIRPTDRVRDVLARDPALLDVFVAQSPRFALLRKPALRRTAAALATVEQAATVAGIPAAALVSALNRAIGAPETAEAARSVSSAPSSTSRPLDRPVVEVDVRDDLRAGREPFARIMAALSASDASAVIRVRAIFEPAPLVGVLSRRGFTCETEMHAPEDWSLWAWRGADEPEAPAPAPVTTGEPQRPTITPPNEEWLDVRGLTPPEPMMRTLAALEVLPADRTLVHLNSRVPQFLLPMLVERGFTYELEHLDSGNILVRIRHSIG